MRYLPLPSSVVPIVAVATLVLVSWLAWASFRDPEAFWAPGNLSRYHADVPRCTQCHAPFQGATSARCIACHGERQFAERSLPEVEAFHREAIRKGDACRGCHTEHRGVLAQIITGALINPHGEFIFRATGARTCTACHTFHGSIGRPPTLLDNAIVRELYEEGEGAHRPGHIAKCLTCHVGGRRDIEGEDKEEEEHGR